MSALAEKLFLPKKLAICVIFHFNENRLQFIDKISNNFRTLADDVLVYIITNTQIDKELEQINSAIKDKGFRVNIFTPTGLGHPYLLPWSHFAIFRTLYDDESISHFMYLEDDILISRENIAYWVKGREQLRPYNLIPSFVRVEQKNSDSKWYGTDCTRRKNRGLLPHVTVSEDYRFINLPEPYQGTYLLDRELMHEHLSGLSSNPEFGQWGIRERAAQGLTFANIPKGFTSRNLVGYDNKSRQIDKACLIHHTPNNYANSTEKKNKFASIPVEKVIVDNILTPPLSLVKCILNRCSGLSQSKSNL